MPAKKSQNKQPKTVQDGRVYVTATFNNTLITITDAAGDTLAWSSTGKVGFKGSRKSTPFAATTAIDRAIEQAKSRGVSTAEVYIKGPGPGRDAALRVLRNAGIKITKIADVTPIPHNGTRAKKERKG